MPCKRIESAAELRKIRDASKGVLAISSGNGTIIHMPDCRVVGGSAPPCGSNSAAENWFWCAGMPDAAHAAPPPLALCPECNPGLDGKIDALNRSGAFLHAEICRTLKSSGYRAAVEYPVQVAPFVQDPLKRPRALSMGKHSADPVTSTAEFQRALAESQHAGLATERVLDIAAAVSIVPSLEMVLPIEVKKVDPGYVDWVFMNYTDAKIDMTATLISTKTMGGPSLFSIPRSDLDGRPLYVEKANMSIPDTEITAYDAAVPLTLARPSGYDFKSRSLNGAAAQVVEGTFGLVTSRIIHQVSTGIGYDTSQCYIPIVVTTANLHSCRYNPDDFEISTGRVSKARLRKEEFLIYECPTPATAVFPHQLTHLDRRKHVQSMTKWQVMIVQAESFEKLLGLVRRAVLHSG